MFKKKFDYLGWFVFCWVWVFFFFLIAATQGMLQNVLPYQTVGFWLMLVMIFVWICGVSYTTLKNLFYNE